MRLEEALHGRRSIRRFADRQPPSDLLPDLIAAACTAPAPHHSRPWRFIMIESSEKRRALIKEMLRAWRLDLEKDDVAASRIDELAARTRRRLADAPLLLLVCLLEDRMRRWPDERRRRAEREMYLHSVGAAVPEPDAGGARPRHHLLSDGLTALLPGSRTSCAGPAG